MKDINVNNLPEELKSLTPEQLELALTMLSEYSDSGSSNTYEELIHTDYEEIPVDIGTFLHDKQYLGNALYDQDGRFTLFPYWENKLKEIFPTNTTTAYNTIVLTGAIGLGKSTVAVICQLYLLYRLLCLKDPYVYYGMQPIDKITISFLNITIENAKGVSGDKFNQLLMSSKWFMAHGTMRGTTNLEYIPDKNIEIIYGSSNNQIIGRALFCLDGETIIKTIDGDKQIKDLENTITQVYSIDDLGHIVLSSPCEVRQTAKTSDIYEIELEDGTIIRCTPSHKFRLRDGSYKEAQYLTVEDELWQ